MTAGRDDAVEANAKTNPPKYLVNEKTKNIGRLGSSYYFKAMLKWPLKNTMESHWGWGGGG